MINEENNENISFEKYVEMLNTPRWFKILLLKIWDLHKGEDNKWTLANLKELIKQTVENYETEIREFLENLIEISKNEQ